MARQAKPGTVWITALEGDPSNLQQNESGVIHIMSLERLQNLIDELARTGRPGSDLLKLFAEINNGDTVNQPQEKTDGNP